jgi:hypothetical protein
MSFHLNSTPDRKVKEMEKIWKKGDEITLFFFGIKQLRTFSPVILFHDHQYVNAGSGDLEHIHIPYGDPSYGRHLDIHKKRIHEMLENNGRYWSDIITFTRGIV